MTLSLPEKAAPGSLAGFPSCRFELRTDQARAIPVNSKGRMARARPASTNTPVSSIQPLAGSGTGGGLPLGVNVSIIEYRPISSIPPAVAMMWVK